MPPKLKRSKSAKTKKTKKQTHTRSKSSELVIKTKPTKTPEHKTNAPIQTPRNLLQHGTRRQTIITPSRPHVQSRSLFDDAEDEYVPSYERFVGHQRHESPATKPRGIRK